jgi:TatD DNase family protein
MLIDTHCHLNADVFKDRIPSLISEAQQQLVTQCFVVGWDQPSSLRAIELAHQFHTLKAIIGVHPVDLKPDTNFDWLKTAYLEHPEHIIAIGEIGLDYYWKKDPIDHQHQEKALIYQLHLANALNLPVVIHCRDAYEAILPILKAHPVKCGGVMHCYAGPAAMVNDFITLGYYLSFGGPITFKKADEARLSVKATPIDRILIETDSPYLSPDPFRGKENTPSFLPIIFKKVASIKETIEATMATILQENTTKLFHVKTK